uniref:Uncharacterized protein n=3 Tax=Gammaproteobacteria TaxID=1236 RepID=A0A482M6B7_KLEPN|nr:hypothetical protein [Enterobacter roggenkampii]QBQ68279.1 hypothetical protein [Klebsiella pneumoniae]QBQ68637.1 hypothetical protein [Klebsiella pneumoniae]
MSWRSESPFTVGFRAYVGFWFHCSPNPKDKATVRLNVSIGGGGVELLATGPKWYDTRKEQGGGAIDLTMHLFRLSFVDAVKRLSP